MTKLNVTFPVSSPNCMNGCLGHSTLITMADGSQHPISQIRTGDRVLARQDGEIRSATVRNVWRGREETMYQIDIANGKNILATKDHPFLTRERVKPAEELQPGDLLLSGSGQEWEKVLQQKKIDIEAEVYNLDLDRENERKPVFFQAEGVWVGDNITQNERRW